MIHRNSVIQVVTGLRVKLHKAGFSNFSSYEPPRDLVKMLNRFSGRERG